MKEDDRVRCCLFLLVMFFAAGFLLIGNASGEKINIKFGDGLVTIHAEDAYLNEILSKLSEKIPSKIQIHGELWEKRISCDIKGLTIEGALKRLFYNWDYVFLTDEQAMSIDLWLMAEKGEQSQIDISGTTPGEQTSEDKTVSQDIQRPKSKTKGFFSIFRPGRR